MAGGPVFSIGWQNGAFVPANRVTLPLLAPGVTYAASVFEGVRAYALDGGPGVALFRLGEHLDRLRRSCEVLGLDEIPDPAEMARTMVDLMARNGVTEDTYIRLQVYVDGDGEMTARGPTGVAMLARPRPQLTARLENGVRCQVSSWRRIGDNASPPRVKAAANYLNGRLAGLQARADGYDTALLLTEDGQVAEAPGACVLLVRDGMLVAPPVTAGILESLTRDTVLKQARDLGVTARVIERPVDRTELYAASEVLLVGTGMEVTPVVGIDRFAVGAGVRGPVTQALQTAFFSTVRGAAAAPDGWLTHIPQTKESGT
ncbi:aminotransferase class IV [Puniceibacterium sp. IMCC21224]|uniref:aminotransferase class IV n=1 Tax=Puniceibacterium sp. IMCC21224 TaxID=1618204 RepID=UPI00064DDCF7|nr:aminotransferase class IV [Puniceibacterium sp. IMCC21224]KMK64874.1 branched-chain amino acid aminotransferase/4-amino-4-deoxychorismate lyase [Puniceibacterium sp. IMCC21224]